MAIFYTGRIKVITFEVIDEMPASTPKPKKRVVVHGNGDYRGGYIRLPDGRQSPDSLNPMVPFRWLARQERARNS